MKETKSLSGPRQVESNPIILYANLNASTLFQNGHLYLLSVCVLDNVRQQFTHGLE